MCYVLLYICVPYRVLIRHRTLYVLGSIIVVQAVYIFQVHNEKWNRKSKHIYIYFIKRKMKISFKCHMMNEQYLIINHHTLFLDQLVYFRKTKVILEKNGGIKEICKTY